MKIGVLLAAGRSTRFGAENKLLAPFQGSPLVTHAAGAMRATNLDLRIAVISDQRVAALLPDFTCLPIDDHTAGQAESIKLATLNAIDLGATRLLFALGDMPKVGADLLGDVLHRCRDDLPSCARAGGVAMPPACFPASYLRDLLGLSGDRGAASLLKGLPEQAMVAANTEQLVDVDTPQDIEALT